jgi:hypothetical protein
MEYIRSVAFELRPGVCHDVTRRALLRLVRSQPSNSSSVFTSLEHFAAIDLGCSNQYLFWRRALVIMLAEMLVLGIEPYFTFFFNAVPLFTSSFLVPELRLILDPLSLFAG